jgi:hypothetical protein
VGGLSGGPGGLHGTLAARLRLNDVLGLMRRPLTWLTIAALGAVVLAATFEVLLRSEPRPEQQTTSVVDTTRVRPALATCREAQLALVIGYLDSPVAILRHVKGGRCRVAETSVSARILSRDGEGQGLLLGPEGNLGGFFASGVEEWAPFRYSPRCGEREPFVAVVRVGDYVARERIRVLRCGIGQ